MWTQNCRKRESSVCKRSVNGEFRHACEHRAYYPALLSIQNYFRFNIIFWSAKKIHFCCRFFCFHGSGQWIALEYFFGQKKLISIFKFSSILKIVENGKQNMLLFKNLFGPRIIKNQITLCFCTVLGLKIIEYWVYSFNVLRPCGDG